ncbi:classical arabinogalactan protein 6-like [Prunus yedoensis var. nudiflora]|uniref:Classical arabinogalactan protein 6-like n=1 Tax=Prunus yedoensis var. nudiflora TaxID=2094558 RepID=A0A314Y291_PRUYE|nr:classical arabinogalactan protein 6-like [Prunus yedoensis var. nudiflora]
MHSLNDQQLHPMHKFYHWEQQQWHVTNTELLQFASASPLAAPGPALLGPTPPPTASSPLSPSASKAVAEAPAPQSGTADDLQPTSPSVESEAPTKSPPGTGRLTPSASASTPSYVSPPSLLLIILGLVVYKSY